MPVRWQLPIRPDRLYRPGFYDRKPAPKAAPLSLEDRVLALIAAAAEVGERCPTDTQIMDALGILTPTALAHLVRGLEQSGRLKVERYKSFRVATITETGLQTRQRGVPKPRKPRKSPTPTKD